MTERDLGQQRISRDGPFRRLVDRLIGVPALIPRVLEAIDELQTTGVTEAYEAQIYKEIRKLHAPEHSWQTVQPGTFFRTLDVLEAEGKIKHRRVNGTKAVETNTDAGRVYQRTPMLEGPPGLGPNITKDEE